MPPKTPKPTVSSVKHQSDHMSKEIANLRSEFQRLQTSLSLHEAAQGVHGNRGQDPETENWRATTPNSKIRSVLVITVFAFSEIR